VDVRITITDNAYGGAPLSLTLAGGAAPTAVPVPVKASAQWYDLSVSATSSTGAALVWARRFMGRMETGADSTSDPAMAAGKPGYVPVPHAFASEAAWHAAMDAAFPIGATGSRETRPKLTWGADGALLHPHVPEHLRVLQRTEGEHKDAKWIGHDDL